MFRSGNWDAADIEDAGINYGFAAFPAYPGGETYINGGGDPAYAISSASTPEKQEAAKTFVEWLGSADGVKLLSEGQGAMSISDNFTSEAAPEFKDAYENNLKKGLFYWIEWSAGAPAMTATMSAQQQMMIQGQATPESFAEAMDAQAASIK